MQVWSRYLPIVAVAGLLLVVIAVSMSGGDDSNPAAPATPGDDRFSPADPPPDVVAPGETRSGAVILGRVLTHENQPVPGRVVRAVQGDRTLRSAEADENGWYEIRGLRPHRIAFVSVEPDGVPMPVDRLGHGDTAHVDLVLAGGDEHVVKVVTEDGDPVAGAEVLARRTSSSYHFPRPFRTADEALATKRPSPLRTESGEDGTARFPPLEGGHWILTALHPDHGRGVAWDGEIVLFPVHSVSGRVTDPDGRPLEGVVVCSPGRYMLMGDPILGGVTSRTDAEGRYRLDGLMEGRRELAAARPGACLKSVTEIFVPLGTTFDITLPAAGTVRGRVTREPDGRPVPGALVVVEFGTYSERRALTGGRAVTDADGRYEVNNLGLGHVHEVRVSRDGYVDHEATYGADIFIVEGVSTVCDVKLEPAARLVGTVRGPDGPVPGAVVTAYGEDWRQEQSAVADLSGRFEFGNLSAGTLDLRTHAAGFHDAETEIEVRVGETREAEVLLEASGEVERDPVFREPAADSGRQIVRVTVDVRTEDGSIPADARVSVDTSSRYGSGDEETFDWVPSGTPAGPAGRVVIPVEIFEPGCDLLLCAGAPGYAPSHVTKIPTRPGVDEARAEIVLGRGHVLEARVVADGTGRPVAGAWACVGRVEGSLDEDWIIQESPPVVHGVSDRDGRLRIPHLPAGAWQVRVSARGFVGEGPVVTLPADGPTEVRMRPALPLAGVVRFEDGGSPGQVSLRFTVSGQFGWETFLSAADGSFFVRGLAPGRYTLEVDRTDTTRVNFVTREFEDIEAGRTDLELVLGRALSIRGRVEDEAGEGVGFVRIRAFDQEDDEVEDYVTTDEHGDFEFFGLLGGRYRLTAETEGYRPAGLEDVPAGPEAVTLVLSRGWTIEGVLVSESGKPLAMHTLSLVRPGTKRHGYSSDLNVRTGENGKFVFPGLDDGEEWEIASGPYDTIWLEDGPVRYHFVLLGDTLVKSGASGLRLIASPGESITGRVTDGEGRPVAGAEVQATPDGRGPEDDAETDADGRFRIDHLHPERKYSVEVNARDLLTKTVEGVVPPQELVVKLERGLSITGRLLSAEGKPLVGWELTFYSSDEGWREVVTDREGRFKVTALPPGKWSVSGEPPGGAESGDVDFGKVEAGARDVVLRVK